jgi:hypothetical protein
LNVSDSAVLFCLFLSGSQQIKTEEAKLDQEKKKNQGLEAELTRHKERELRVAKVRVCL